jgi:hypothetical protein
MAVVLSMVMFVPFISFQGAAEAEPQPMMTIETIEVSGNASECHIAVDLEGNVHICYLHENGSLMYVTNTGGEWTTQTMVGPGLAGRACSIAVDSEGGVHVSYVGADGEDYGDLMYATNEDGSWDNQVIDDGYIDGFTSIAVDAQDNIHISYHTGNSYENDNLRYATDKNGSWTTEVVDTGQAGYYSAIAVDAQSNVHIVSYAGIGGLPLRYSTNAGGSWSSQDIEESVWIGGQCSIAVDSQGHPHVAASTSDEISQVDLKHAVYSGSSWSSEAIELGGYVWDRSIAVDAQDAVHICYRAYADNDLRYMTNASGSWSTRTVEGLGSSTSHASMAVEAGGIAHMCYISTDSSGDHLKYVRIGDVQPSGSTVAVDPAEVVEGSSEPAPDAVADDEAPAIEVMPSSSLAGIGGIGLLAVISVAAVLLMRRRTGP